MSKFSDTMENGCSDMWENVIFFLVFYELNELNELNVPGVGKYLEASIFELKTN